MKLKEKDYARLVVAAAEKNIPAKKFAPEFWTSLYRDKSLAKLNRIFQLAEEIDAAKNASIVISVRSAIELKPKQREDLEQELATRFVKRVIASYEVDTSLGSGLKVIYGDKIVDLSSKNQIERLNKHLNDNHRQGV